MAKKVIIISIIVLFLLIGVFGFWYWNRNPYSKDVLKIEIIGPQEADFSQEVEYTVKYKNNGNVRLEEPTLEFDFPDYSVVDDSLITRKEVGPDELGDIYPGEEKTYTFKGRLFGKEGDLKTVTAKLSYQPKNLSARYESDTTFTTKIKSIPLTFDLDLPSKSEPNKELDFSINYYSTLDYSLSDLSIKINYPDGFEFIGSSPQSLSNNEWDIPILNKAEGGRIDIKGKIAAELGDIKMFSAQIGFWREGELVIMKEINKGVEITQPSIDVYQEINGEKNYIASAGDLLHYEIYFRNIGDRAFSDLFLVARLDGDGFDLNTLKTTDGDFQQGDNTIIWDGKSVPKLALLDQGEEGKVEFWVNLKDDWGTGSPPQKNVVLKNTVLVSKMKEEFDTKVNSNFSLTQQVQGAFQPTVGQDSTYNITWQVKNDFNDVKNVKVRAVLPPNVRLTGDISPSDMSSNFAFDNSSREVVWSVGDMEAGQTSSTISFQVVLNPIFNQRGDQAVLAEQIRVQAEDTWTERSVDQAKDDLKTPQEVQ
jgi:hypothetical protein